MARRILNRRELRAAGDAAERGPAGPAGSEAEPKATPTAKKPAVKRKSRAKVNKEVRLKAFWGVFSQSLAQVAQYDYSQRADAEQRAKELTESKKSPHFVQLVKKVIEE